MTDTLREAVERLAVDVVYADVPTWVVDRVHDILAAHPAPDTETERIVDLSGMLASNELCAAADARGWAYRDDANDAELAAADAIFVTEVERIVATYVTPPAETERASLVIDPEDNEQVEQLAKCYRDVSGWCELTDDKPWSIPGLRMQAALRAMRTLSSAPAPVCGRDECRHDCAYPDLCREHPLAPVVAPPSVPAGSDTAGELMCGAESISNHCTLPRGHDGSHVERVGSLNVMFVADTPPVPSPAPADERERARILTDFDGETYAALIDAAHQEQRQALAADRSEETMTLFQHWSATAGWLAARKRAKDRTGEPDWPDAMVSAGSREREGEHVLTTNGMGYFWCSCDLHQAHVLWSLNEHIAEIADRSAAHDAALRAEVEKDYMTRSRTAGEWLQRANVAEARVTELEADLAALRDRAGRTAEQVILALRVDPPLDDFQRGANAVLARAASIARAAAEGGGE